MLAVESKHHSCSWEISHDLETCTESLNPTILLASTVQKNFIIFSWLIRNSTFLAFIGKYSSIGENLIKIISLTKIKLHIILNVNWLNRFKWQLFWVVGLYGWRIMNTCIYWQGVKIIFDFQNLNYLYLGLSIESGAFSRTLAHQLPSYLWLLHNFLTHYWEINSKSK